MNQVHWGAFNSTRALFTMYPLMKFQVKEDEDAYIGDPPNCLFAFDMCTNIETLNLMHVWKQINEESADLTIQGSTVVQW